MDAANFVFSNILSGGDGRDGLRRGRVRSTSARSTTRPGRTCETEFHLISAQQNIGGKSVRPVKRLLAEARFTAQRIRQLLDEGYPVHRGGRHAAARAARRTS